MDKKQRKKKADLTAKTMEYLRGMSTEDEPVFVDKVEQPFNQYTKRTQDLYGIFDVVYLIRRSREIDTVHPPHSEMRYTLVAVQITSRDNMSSRCKKIAEAPEAAAWLESGNAIEVWGWDQPAGHGTKWRHNVRSVAPSDLKH